MQRERLRRFEVAKLLSQMGINLDSYKDRSIEREDVFQDTMEQTLVYTKGDYTRVDFSKLFWYNFKLVKARLFDKRSGKVMYAARSLYDKDDNCVHEPTLENNNYEDQELIGLIKTHCPLTYTLSTGYNKRELFRHLNIPQDALYKKLKKERAIIKQYL